MFNISNHMVRVPKEVSCREELVTQYKVSTHPTTLSGSPTTTHVASELGNLTTHHHVAVAHLLLPLLNILSFNSKTSKATLNLPQPPYQPSQLHIIHTNPHLTHHPGGVWHCVQPAVPVSLPDPHQAPKTPKYFKSYVSFLSLAPTTGCFH